MTNHSVTVMNQVYRYVVNATILLYITYLCIGISTGIIVVIVVVIILVVVVMVVILFGLLQSTKGNYRRALTMFRLVNTKTK